MVLKDFSYYHHKKKKRIFVEICDTPWKKAKGLMFRKNSLPLLFLFKKSKKLSIHSFFCRPFSALWLNENKEVTKILRITKWRPSFSGYGKYLLEIPTPTRKISIRRKNKTFK